MKNLTATIYLTIAVLVESTKAVSWSAIFIKIFQNLETIHSALKIAQIRRWDNGKD
jgi:hypothetical protein